MFAMLFRIALLAVRYFEDIFQLSLLLSLESAMKRGDDLLI